MSGETVPKNIPDAMAYAGLLNEYRRSSVTIVGRESSAEGAFGEDVTRAGGRKVPVPQEHDEKRVQVVIIRWKQI